MKKISTLLLLFPIVALGMSSCSKDTPVDPTLVENPNEYVNNWIYDNMKTYYYWNDKIPTNVNKTVDPQSFFKSLLNKFDATTNPDGDRFSWIQENYVDLKKALSGVVTDEIGFESVRLALSNTTTKQYYLLVLYPKKGTDAYNKGVKRGDFIVKINDQDITESNYSSLIGGTGTKKLNIARFKFNTDKNDYELVLAPDPITIQMQKDFAESPIYMDKVFTINDKKIGYLVYNFFSPDNDDNSYSYDKELMQTLAKMNDVQDFILDLRYNSGGSLSSAIALTSALVKNRSTNNLMATFEYNKNRNDEFSKKYGEGWNKQYFIDKITTPKDEFVADIPAMNLPRLYVIVSRWTASASEFVINSLKPYMEVILIGENTVGKNVGSISIYKENDPKNKWGMQPIVMKYFNSQGNSDFTAGFTPEPQNLLSELKTQVFFDFGDTRDLYLNRALSIITGTNIPTRAAIMTRSSQRFSVVKNGQSIRINQLNDDVNRDKLLNISPLK